MKKKINYMNKFVDVVPISTTIHKSSYKIAKDFSIKWSDAIELGIKTKVKEIRREEDFTTDTEKLKQTIENLSYKLGKANHRIFQLEQKNTFEDDEQ